MLHEYFNRECSILKSESFNYHMTYKPQDETIARHIDYYWIVENGKEALGNSAQLHAYPGITPDLIIVLKGSYTFHYLGKTVSENQGMLFSFIHDEVQLNLSSLDAFILVKFKSRALSSLQPFVNYTSSEIMANPIDFSKYAFNGTISSLPSLLQGHSEYQIVDILDHWFLSHYRKEREGFVVEMAEEISPNFDLQKIMEATNYSYSTIERHFKRETGLTPKKFQTLSRFKAAVTEICATKNNDWLNYVTTYDYYDQAHFIKEVKKFARVTPNQLLATPSFVSYRPQV